MCTGLCVWIIILTPSLWAVLLVGPEKMGSEIRRTWPERMTRVQRARFRDEEAWLIDKGGVAMYEGVWLWE